MDIEIRPIAEDEFAPFVHATNTAFGSSPDSDAVIEAERPIFELERSRAAFEGSRVVGTSGVYSFEITLPGLTRAPAAGVSWVSVLPTHRRRGILRRMMEAQLRDSRERGEPLSILLASESSIYGRFGYGLSTTQTRLEIDTRYGASARPIDVSGSVRLHHRDEARQLFPRVFDRFRQQQPGSLSRSPHWWDNYFQDLEQWRDGMSARFYVSYTPAGGDEPTGYIGYRVRNDWQNGMPNNTVWSREFFTLDSESLAGLWQYLMSIDLVTTVQLDDRPSEDPLRWFLTEPRRLRTARVIDFLWVRPVDVVAALGDRRYAIPDEIVFQVEDPFLPHNSGVYCLEGGPDGAICRRSSGEPQFSMQVDDLGAAYLGGVSFSTLARACRVTEHVPGTLLRADLMFHSDPPAWCTQEF